jgi:putative MATE family efflux protein
MSKSLSLTQGRVPEVLIRFSIPFLLASLLQVAYGAADVFFIGRFDVKEAISGVAAGNQCMNLINSLFMGLTMGGTVLVGQYVGAKMEKEAAATIGNVIVVFGAVAVFTTLAMLVFGDLLIGLLQVPTEAVPDAKIYLTICAIGSTFIMGYNIVGSILRGLGDSKTPLIFVAIAFVIHIILNYLLIVLLRWGAAGAAVSTVVSQAVSLVISILYIKKRGLPFPFSGKDIRLEKTIIARIFKIGIPVSMQYLMMTLSFMIITAVTNSMGLIYSAGVGVVSSLINFCLMIPSSLGSAISAITAQNIGAGQPDRATKSTTWGILFSLGFAVIFCVSAQLWPEWFVSLVTKDPDVIREGARYLIPFAWDSVLVCFVFCFNGLFSGSGKTIFVMVHNIATTFAVRIPIAYFMSQKVNADLFEVGLGTPFASLASLILCVIYLAVKFNKKELHKLTVIH